MQPKLEKKQWEDWEYLILDRGQEKPLAFIMHGYGANANDLASLANYLDPGGQFTWVFPEAPVELPMPFGNARAWFPIDEQAIQQAMMTGKPRDFRAQKVDGLTSLVDKLESLVRSFGDRKVMIGGFSQGGMMSLHLHAALSDRLCGLLLMSSALVDEQVFKMVSAPVFPSLFTHGIQDPVVSNAEGEYASKKLMTHGYQVDFYSFNGAHEINMGALEKIKKFLSSLV